MGGLRHGNSKQMGTGPLLCLVRTEYTFKIYIYIYIHMWVGTPPGSASQLATAFIWQSHERRSPEAKRWRSSPIPPAGKPFSPSSSRSAANILFADLTIPAERGAFWVERGHVDSAAVALRRIQWHQSF